MGSYKRFVHYPKKNKTEDLNSDPSEEIIHYINLQTVQNFVWIINIMNIHHIHREYANLHLPGEQLPYNTKFIPYNYAIEKSNTSKFYDASNLRFS